MPAGHGSAAVTLAFYGRTNQHGQEAAASLERQYSHCCHVASGWAVITAVFFDHHEPTDEVLLAAAEHRDLAASFRGGWPELAAALPRIDRDFDGIIADTADRLGRRAAVVTGRVTLAAAHPVPILVASELRHHSPATHSDVARRLGLAQLAPGPPAWELMSRCAGAQ